MRFPLAAFCAAFVVTMLAAALLPGAVLYAAIGLAAAAVVLLLVRSRRGKGRARSFLMLGSLILAGVLAAVLCRGVYNHAVLRPVAALADTTAKVRARVTATRPGYSEETLYADVQVLEGIDQQGNPVPAGFSVGVNGLPPVEVGDELLLPLRFYTFSTASARRYGYAKGFAVGAALDGEAAFLGASHTVETRLRQLQYAASENIRARLPQRLGSVAAAMSVGDRRFLPYEVTGAYRVAGLSHLLVVSGLHLSLLAGALHRLLARFLRRRPAALASMGFVVLFMGFTGLAPSIVRSGFMWCMIFLGDALGRKAHPPTSLALAVAVMALQNPYSVLDVGLQLSVMATLGMLLANGAFTRLKNWGKDKHGTLPRRYKAALAVLPQAFVIALTLPVLIAAEMGVSLLSIPTNLLVLPLVPAIVLSGFVMALPALPILHWIGTAAALVSGLLLRVVELVCAVCALVPGAYRPVGGGFALAAVVLLYALLAMGWARRQIKAFGALSLTVLLLATGLHVGFSAGTVRVVVAGGSNPSLVIIQNGQAAVLYRSRTSANAVANVFWRYQVKECVLLVDLRSTTESTEYIDLFQPQQVVVAQDDLVVGGQYPLANSATISIARQSTGTFACVEIDGYKVGCYTGSVNLAPYPAMDVLLVGRGKASGEAGTLLCDGALPAWADELTADTILISDGQPGLWIRPGKSVLFREVLDGDSV